LQADKEFELELLIDGASPDIAELMFKAVDIFGDGLMKTSFSWGLPENSKVFVFYCIFMSDAENVTSRRTATHFHA